MKVKEESKTQIQTEAIGLAKLHKRYVKNTPKEAIVVEKTILLCNLPVAVTQGGGFKSSKVYVKTRVLKHIYDKKTAQIYDTLLSCLVDIVKFPSTVYKNKDEKRGSKCLVKEINGIKYFAVLEEDTTFEGNYLVTAFKVEDIYLKDYEEIWSWGGGNSHRNILDATRK